MINKYKDKFMVWQLHNRTEIVAVAFVIGAILFNKGLMPYEFSRSIKEKYSNGTGSSFSASRNVYWR